MNSKRIVGTIAAVTAVAGLSLVSPATADAASTPLMVVGHRGTETSGSLIENTVGAVKSALQAGATGIEADVRLTKDNRTVVMHDATMDRTTNCTGSVESKTYDQVRACKTDDGKVVPNLYEIAAAVKQYSPSAQLWWHIKFSPTTSKAKDIVGVSTKYGITSRTVIMGESKARLAVFSTSGGLKKAMIFNNDDVERHLLGKASGEDWDAKASYLVPYQTAVTPALVAGAQARGVKVLAVEDNWVTLDNVRTLGLDGLMANDVVAAVGELR